MKKILLLSLIITAGAFLFLKSDHASAQTCLTPPSNAGRVTLSADLTAGSYRVWSRMKAADRTNNSFYIQINQDCPMLIGDSPNITANNWTWVDYLSSNTGTSPIKAEAKIAQDGKYTITIIGNENGVGVDKLLLTKDFNCVPEGISGENCASEPNQTVPACLQSDIAPETGPAPLTVFLHGGATAGGSDSLIEGYQWDFDNDGTWDTETEIDPLNHTYNEPGIYDPKYRVQGSNGLFSETCDYKFQVIVEKSDPNPTILRFQSIKLHGIGSGGDNTNPNLTGNQNPVRTSRPFEVEIIDENNNSILTTDNTMTYNSIAGSFSGDAIFPTEATSGDYIVKVKAPQYLRKQVIGISTITKGEVNTISPISLTTGDINNNNSLTIDDYNILIDCYSDILPARDCTDESKKASADLSDDGKVNANDYNLFLRELSVVNGD